MSDDEDRKSFLDLAVENKNFKQGYYLINRNIPTNH
jgi:hypothetical protein